MKNIHKKIPILSSFTILLLYSIHNKMPVPLKYSLKIKYKLNKQNLNPKSLF
jgi:hypothetical protein